MARISDPEDVDSHPQASSSKSKITNGLLYLPTTREDDSLNARLTDNKNPLADFEFDKLPTELLVEIFRHTRADSLYDAHNEKHRYPTALSQVCRHWRATAVGAPTLWADIRVLGYHTEQAKEAARVYLERSKGCPIFLTWFTDEEELRADVPAVVERLIIPAAERWQRITLIAGTKTAPNALLTAMESLNFPILRDIEISCVPWMVPFSPTPTFCRSAPLLHRCRFHDIFSLPSLPSNLVVFDYVFLAPKSAEFDLDILLEFLPHVAHSLEHLRFGPPLASGVHFTPGTPKIPLENLKSLLITNSHTIMDHILTPNLTCFVAFHPPETDAKGVAEMFQGFSAPKLRSIEFYKTPLSPLLTMHNLPSMFPQLESVLLSDCADESTFVSLLEPPKPKKPSSLEKGSRHPQKDRKVENPFPHLKELTVSNMEIWSPLLEAIVVRFKNGDKSLRKIQLSRGSVIEAVIPDFRLWLRARGVELVLYKPGELPRSTPEFQDEFCDEEDRLFFETTMKEFELSDDEDYGEDYEDYGEDYGEGYDEDYDDNYLAYEPPSYVGSHRHWDGFSGNDEEGYEGEFRWDHFG